jgi:predicted transporter
MQPAFFFKGYFLCSGTPDPCPVSLQSLHVVRILSSANASLRASSDDFIPFEVLFSYEFAFSFAFAFARLAPGSEGSRF